MRRIVTIVAMVILAALGGALILNGLYGGNNVGLGSSLLVDGTPVHVHHHHYSCPGTVGSGQVGEGEVAYPSLDQACTCPVGLPIPSPTPVPCDLATPSDAITSHSSHTEPDAQATPTPTVPPVPAPTSTSEHSGETPTSVSRPTFTPEPTATHPASTKAPCNRGLGNGPELCDPGNSTPRPGAAGERNEPAGPPGLRDK